MTEKRNKVIQLSDQLREGTEEIIEKAGDAFEQIQDIQPEDVLTAAMKVPGAKVNREKFLRKELIRYYPEEIVQLAIDKNPAFAGIPRWSVNKIAKEVISYETNKVSGLSLLAGLPGGVAMIGTIPADFAQYFGFMLRVMQKLAYLYGFDEFEFDEEQVSDSTMNEMLIFMGVMFGVDAANGGVKLIADAAANKVSKTLARKALTQGTVYPIVKKVLQVLGIKMTKEIFAKSVSKVVPVVGGVVSGGLSYVTFRTCCVRLQKNFNTLNLSDPAFYHDDEELTPTLKKKDRKTQLKEIFLDTQEFYSEDPALVDAVTFGRSNTKLYEADEYLEVSNTRNGKKGVVLVTKDKTFEAATKLHIEFPDKKIAVLNFASATSPGGGVKKGSSSQEESLCRCSTLFPTIDRKWLLKSYYNVNRAAKDIRFTDACIYSPGVIICKTDDDYPKRLEPEEFVCVDVITCAAPNLKRQSEKWINPETGNPMRMDPEELYSIHVRRAKRILQIAAINGVEVLVLGAFGCGAFANDPDVVSKAYYDALQEHRNWFDIIDFAIFCRAHETDNYKAFYNRFKDEIQTTDEEMNNEEK